MKYSYRTGLAACALAGVLLSACAGPSTRVLPREDGSRQTYEMPEEMPVLEEVNPFYLQEELEILTALPRGSGSRGESDAARYMQRLLEDYGYDVKCQRFRFDDGAQAITGTNVVAVRTAPSPDADILIVSSHHDAVKGSPGAAHSASGVVTLLETARLLSRLPTDTELRFVSFAGHEADRLGARYYMGSLTKRERERVIGAVDLDALGYVSDSRIMLGTLDGGPTMLGDMLGEASRDVLGETWPYRESPSGSAGAFAAGGIAAVCVGQGREAFEYGTPLDTADIVDIERVSQAVDVVSQMVSRAMSPDTPSMMAKSHFSNDLRGYAFVQEKDAVIPFGKGREESEASIGIFGSLVVTNTDAAGRKVEKYQYRMKWFGVDQVILTNYYYADGMLELVSLDADEAGVDFEDMKERLTDTYGEPVGENIGPSGTEFDWADPVTRKFIALIPGSGGYDVEIREYSMDKTVLEQRNPGGEILLRNIADARPEKMMGLLKKILPGEAWERIGAVTFYSDGVGGTDGYLAPMEAPGASAGADAAPGGEQAVWELGIDVDDAMKPDGSWRNETQAIRTVTRLYGQFLEASMPGRYSAMFERQFYGSMPEGTGMAEGPGAQEGQTAPAGPEKPEGPEAQGEEPAGGQKAEDAQGAGSRNVPGAQDQAARAGAVSEAWAEDGLTPPDFETAFQFFVLSHKPDNMTGDWSGRIGFFYGFEELSAYRKWVRGNLQLHTGAAEEGEGKTPPGIWPESQPQS